MCCRRCRWSTSGSLSEEHRVKPIASQFLVSNTWTCLKTNLNTNFKFHSIQTLKYMNIVRTRCPKVLQNEILRVFQILQSFLKLNIGKELLWFYFLSLTRELSWVEDDGEIVVPCCKLSPHQEAGWGRRYISAGRKKCILKLPQTSLPYFKLRTKWNPQFML